MAKLENMRADVERGLKVRLKRIEHATEKGGRTGTLVELEAAEKDVKRATDRLGRARTAHALTTREVQDYADTLTKLGGTPELPEGFAVFRNPDVSDVENLTDAELVAELNGEDPDATPLPGEDTTETFETDVADTGDQPRKAGRFARRGTQV